MSKKSAHVVPSTKGGWSVRTSGAARAAKVFDTQEEAIKYARTLAKNAGSELYIHGRDGSIRDKDTYSNDPFPPRDRNSASH